MADVDPIRQYLPSRSMLAAAQRSPKGLMIGSYRHPPATIEAPALSNTVVVIHRNGPVAVEEWRARTGWVRKWTEKGHVTLTPAGMPIRRRFQARPEVLIVQVEPCLLEEVSIEALDVDPRLTALRSEFAEPDLLLTNYCELLVSEMEQGQGPGQALAQDILARAITLVVLRRYSMFGPSAVRRPVAIAPGRLRRVVDYMNDHIDGSPSLTELAGLSSLSASQFSRAFRSAMGTSPHRYLVDLKIEQARRLLATTKMSVTQISESCGFQHTSSFSTAFRKRVGVTPREWRIEQG